VEFIGRQLNAVHTGGGKVTNKPRPGMISGDDF